MEMKRLTIVLTFSLAVYNGVSCKKVEEHQTVFQGKNILFSCTSSYVPIWEWEGNNQKENLAIGTSKRENVKDIR